MTSKPLKSAEIILLIVVVGVGAWFLMRKPGQVAQNPTQHVGPWPSHCTYNANYYYDEDGIVLIERKYVLMYTSQEGTDSKEYPSSYVSDGNKVFWVGHDLTPECMPLGGANPAKVIALSWDWAKDDNHVYFHGRLVADADAATFQLLGDAFAKDTRHLYDENMGITAEQPGVVVTDVHLATLQQIKNTELGNQLYLYFKDNRRVYLVGELGFKVIPSADSASFKVLNICGSSEAQKRYFAKDKNTVWCGEKLIGADPVTFTYIGEYDECGGGPPCSSGIAIDKTCIYRGSEKVKKSDGTCYDPSTCSASNL